MNRQELREFREDCIERLMLATQLDPEKRQDKVEHCLTIQTLCEMHRAAFLEEHAVEEEAGRRHDAEIIGRVVDLLRAYVSEDAFTGGNVFLSIDYLENLLKQGGAS